MDWLDTETKAILQREHDSKLAPSRAAEFGLVLIRNGNDERRLVRAICAINNCLESEAVAMARRPTPVLINPGLTEAEALSGQFELICCDAVSAFVRSEVLLEQDQKEYLEDLFRRVLQSPEFTLTPIDVVEVPATEAGERFIEQFLGGTIPEEQRPVDEFSLKVPFKKARLMKHWADRIGARVQCDLLQSSTETDTL